MSQSPGQQKLIFCGITHHSAPLALREIFSLSVAEIEAALAELSKNPLITEVAILSTCNRTELYAVTKDASAGLAVLQQFINERSRQTLTANQLMRLMGDDVALHLFRVTAGLDSMILGESHIAAQVKNAHRLSKETGSSGTHLHYVFQRALQCAKKVKSAATGIVQLASPLDCAIALGKKQLGSLSGKNALVIGAGSMGMLALHQLLSRSKVETITLLNRSQQRLSDFQNENIGPKVKLASDFSNMYNYIAQADFIIVATSADKPLITSCGVASVASKTEKKCIVDLSVPRNVADDLALDSRITLFNIDDLTAQAQINAQARNELLQLAEPLIFAELAGYNEWLSQSELIPAIVKMRNSCEQARLAELQKLGQEEPRVRQRTAAITRAVLRKILHVPTVSLKKKRSKTVPFAEIFEV